MGNFKKGDVVRLKGSRITMAVESIDQELGVVECVWHDDHGKLQERSFEPELLDKAQEDISGAI